MIDYLQRKQNIENITTVIDNLSRLKTSSTFAIDGQWGCGKTFLLDLLEEELSSVKKNSSNDSQAILLSVMTAGRIIFTLNLLFL